MALRSAERGHRYHEAMHQVVERLERLLTLFVLLVLGIALTRGQLESLDLAGVAVALALVFVAALVVGGSGGPDGLLRVVTLGIVLLLVVIYLGNRRDERSRR